jgi:hypothetical protein
MDQIKGGKCLQRTISVDPIKVREKGTSLERGCHSCRVSPVKARVACLFPMPPPGELYLERSPKAWLDEGGRHLNAQLKSKGRFAS